LIENFFSQSFAFFIYAVLEQFTRYFHLWCCVYLFSWSKLLIELNEKCHFHSINNFTVECNKLEESFSLKKLFVQNLWKYFLIAVSRKLRSEKSQHIFIGSALNNLKFDYFQWAWLIPSFIHGIWIFLVKHLLLLVQMVGLSWFEDEIMQD